jgi:MFS family permease
MPIVSSGGRALGKTIKGARLTARGGTRAGRWVGRSIGVIRHRGGAGDTGMMRLLDLHAVSCAGDTLVTLGLAGTVFFTVPAGEARGRVALYLLITMVPFALLAPLVGPLLDRFRHGRRYALATTMLGRAFLAWIISDSLGGLALYPAAFGVLALSRAYGVARSAAVPRLLPPGLGLSEAGARASIFGTLAGAAVAPLGILAFWVGHAWPLRLASVIFLIGMVIALRLPKAVDSEEPEVPPQIFKLPNRDTVKVLSGRLLIAVLTGSAILRAVYGFLTLFLAFSIRSNDLTTQLFGVHLSQTKALAYAVGALGVGTFIATGIGSRMKIHRPTLLQAGGIAGVALAAILATAYYTLGTVIILCLATAIVSGLAKLAVDATIQEQIPEQVRASAFAHSETLLMIAWVAGGAVGLLPFPGRVGLGIAAAGLILAAIRSTLVAVLLRNDRLAGRASGGTSTVELDQVAEPATEYRGPADDERQWLPAAAYPAGAQIPHGAVVTQAYSPTGLAVTRVEPGPAARATTPVPPAAPKTSKWHRMFSGSETPPAPPIPAATPPAPPIPAATPPATTTTTIPGGEADQPGYHLYRPSSPDGPSTRPSGGASE